MLKHIIISGACALSLASFSTRISAQESESKANVLYKHGLVDDAKREAIDTVFSSAPEEDQAKAKLLLARIAVDEDRLHHAVELWTEIVQNHPQADATQQAKLLLDQSVSLIDEQVKIVIDDTVAQAYFSAAEFWLSDVLDVVVEIDTSYISSEEAGVHWLDKMIAEFPGTRSAELAHRYRIRTYIGSSGSGRFGLGGSGAWGAASRVLAGKKERLEDFGSLAGEVDKARKDFSSYAGKAEEAMRAFEAEFPESKYLPRLRYMIAHIYWMLDMRDSAEPWLKATIEESDGRTETFWTHLAQSRLENWNK